MVFVFLSYEQLSSRCLATVDIVVINVLMSLVEIDVDRAADALSSTVVLLLAKVYVLFFCCHTLIHSNCCSNSHISDKVKTRVARFTLHQIPFATLTSQVMRLRPVVPLGVPHGVVEEVEVSGWRLPKATMVMPLHWAINRSNI